MNVNQAGNANSSLVDQIGVAEGGGNATTVKIKQDGSGNKSTVDQGDIWNNGATSLGGVATDVYQQGRDNKSLVKQGGKVSTTDIDQKGGDDNNSKVDVQGGDSKTRSRWFRTMMITNQPFGKVGLRTKFMSTNLEIMPTMEPTTLRLNKFRRLV